MNPMVYYVHKGNYGGVTVGCKTEKTVENLLVENYDVVGGAHFWRNQHMKPKPNPLYRFTQRGFEPARYHFPKTIRLTKEDFHS